MDFRRFLAFKNMRRRPVRTGALMLLAAFLAMSVFTGAVVVTSLRNGLKSYEDRLGADVVVVPYQARTKGGFESILLQGIPGTFYMDEQYYEKVKTIEGVREAAPQFFLASASAGCCSVAVQIIGFDPDRDFTVQPWIRQKYSGELGPGDIIVGSRITVPKDRILTFYGTDCRVAAQLDETGTGLDTAVYAGMDTIRDLMKRSRELGFHYFDGADPDHTVSSVMVKVEEGYDPAAVAGDINIHVRHIEAAPAAGMISGIASGLAGISRVIGILTVLVWVLAVVILVVAFAMIAHERAREFAVLRVIGASKRMVSGLLLLESALVCFAGAAAGVLLAMLLVFSFQGLISASLKLPYLLPSPVTIALLAAGAAVLTTAAGALAAAFSAGRISRNDAGLLLRESV